MNYDNKPPSLTKFSKYLGGKLQSHLEWPNFELYKFHKFLGDFTVHEISILIFFFYQDTFHRKFKDTQNKNLQ